MKNVMVTGAGAGLGRAIARHFDREGWRVGVLDLIDKNAQSVAAELSNAVPFAVDVTNEEDVEAAFTEFGDELDACVCNAGILRTGSLLEHSVEDFRLVTDINLVSVFITARAAARRMTRSGGGSIITIASINAINPLYELRRICRRQIWRFGIVQTDVIGMGRCQYSRKFYCTGLY